MRACALLLALCALALGASAATPPPREEVSRLTDQAQRAFTYEGYTQLDELYDRHAEVVAADGSWLAEAFEYAFDAMFTTTPLLRLERQFAQWKEAAPASRLRPVAEAMMWEARSRVAQAATCESRDPAGRPLAERQLARADAALRQASEASRSPLWYVAALRIAGGRGEGEARMTQLLEAGTAAYPRYLSIRWARGRYLLPPWIEDPSLFHGFAREQARSQPDAYAMLFVYAARDGCRGFFDGLGASWPEMRAGFRARLRLHDAPWNWNLLGTYACRFGDRETTLEVLERMGKEAKLDIWMSGQSTQSCLDFVRDASPPKRRTALSSSLRPRAAAASAPALAPHRAAPAT